MISKSALKDFKLKINIDRKQHSSDMNAKPNRVSKGKLSTELLN